RLSRQNVVIFLFYGMHDRNLEVLSKTLKEFNDVLIVFIYQAIKGLVAENKLKESLFDWCVQNQFTNVLLVLNVNQKYETWFYKVMLKVHIFKLNLEETAFTSYAYSNMGRYRSSVGVFQSLPDAYVFNPKKQFDLTGRSLALGGQTGILIAEFLRYTNGTMEIHLMTFDEYFNPKHGINQMDIGANMVSNNSLAPYSPLIMSGRFCIVLPFVRPLPLNEIFTFVWANTTILGIWIFYSIANAIIKLLVNPRISLEMVLYSTFYLSTCQTTTSFAFRRLGLPEKLIVVFTQIYNLLIVSIICSALTMALATGLHKPDIVDIDTFLASGLRIMVHRPQMVNIFKSDKMPNVLTERLLLVDSKERDYHLYSLNDSYAYIIEEHQWAQLEYIQRRLHQPKLKLASDKLCSVHHYLRLPIRPVLPYRHILSHFVAQARETGLMDKWLRIAIEETKLAGLIIQAPYEAPGQNPLSMQFFRSLFIWYGVGIGMGFMVMLLELVYGQSRKFILFS
ncbi:hypothetical protein KR222_011323, partial [Zaprionus bogoriensis]